MSARFCTTCGSPVVGAFCTACGAPAKSTPSPDPPRVDPPQAAAPPPPRPKAALRCVECGSDIPHGLVCARCAAMRAPAPLTPAPYHKPTGGDGEKGRWVPWVVWPLTVLIGLAYFASKAGMELSDLPTLSSLPSAEDGTYLYEAPVEEGGMWMRIAIRRGEAKLTASFGLSGTCRVERKGDTLRLVGGQLYQDGRPVPTLSQSRVDLMTVVDDGQALWIKDEGLNIRLIKQ